MKANPKYKIRYASGLGDILTCFFHSRYIKKIVKFFTNNEEQCESCTNRAFFLNLFFPIPIWKFFYKTIDERFLAFKKDMEDYGFVFDIVDQKKEEQKICNCDKNKIIDTTPLNALKIDYIEYDGYSLKSKQESNEGDYKVLKFTYKKI